MPCKPHMAHSTYAIATVPCDTEQNNLIDPFLLSTALHAECVASHFKQNQVIIDLGYQLHPNILVPLVTQPPVPTIYVHNRK